MSDTTKRDAVCQEFGAWHQGQVPEEVHWSAAEAMADEIVRLRAAAKDSADHYADARAEIDRLRAAIAADQANRETTLTHFGLLYEFGHHGCDTLQWVCDELVSERAAMERVRALHEPIATHVTCIDALCCDECSDDDSVCFFPCPTLRALDGEL